MLDRVFMQILDMSKTASIVILVVLAVRLFLKKAPKAISYALWAVVLLRLLCPVNIETSMSVMPEITPLEDTYDLADVPISFVGAGVAAYQAMGDALNGGLGVQHIPTTQKDMEGNVEYVTADWWDVWILFGQYVWLAGVAVMAIYSMISYWKLRKQLAVTVLLRDNIYIADDIDTPFVIGFVRPKIYLPGTLREKERQYIILHEQHHIKRMDHIIKILAFLALMLHWFNPLVWLAFILASRDMEMSCDEAVIRKLGAEVRADYSASLLALATGKRIIGGTPLAFGEGDPKGRIRNLAKWKQPILWVTAVLAVLCLVLAICLLTDPTGAEDPTQDTEPAAATTIPQQTQQAEAAVPTTETQPAYPPETTDFTEPTEPTLTENIEIPDGIPGVVTYSKDLEELPPNYTPQQAAADDCVVMIDGDVWANDAIWIAYTIADSRGENVKVRIADYDGAGKIKRLYELVSIKQGYLYRLLDNGSVEVHHYRFLGIDGNVDFEGDTYNMFEVYALTNEPMWKFRKGVPYDDNTWEDDSIMAFCNLYMRYEHPPLPETLQCVEIMQDGETLAVIWDQQKLRQIREFLAIAEGYNNWPKTVVMGPTLIFRGADGSVVNARMMANATMVEIDGVFYNYDPGWREEYQIEDLLALLGISELP